MNKQHLRTHYKSLRNELSQDDIETKSLEIANQLLKLDIWNASFYHVFLSITEQKEVQTDYLLKHQMDDILQITRLNKYAIIKTVS